ncbi:hypothetical protein HNQ00_002833 [Flavobacterium sp. 14A]|nr:hypothetical protein [Flavobacterium sp. 14A]
MDANVVNTSAKALGYPFYFRVEGVVKLPFFRWFLGC